MVQTLIRYVRGKALLLQETVHPFHRGRLVVVGPGVHALDAKALVIGPELHGRKVRFLFVRCFLHRPVEVRPGHEVREPDHGDPLEFLFVRVVDAQNALLPPEALQRRDNVIEIALDPMIALLAHLDRVGHAVQQPDGPLIRPAFLVGIALPPDREIVHGRHSHDGRRVLRQIKLLVFFFEIKRHG